MDSPDPVMPSPSTSTTSASSESSPSQSSSSIADYHTNTGDSSTTLTFLLIFLAIFVVFMGTVVGGRRAFARRRAAAEEARMGEERRAREDQRPMMWDPVSAWVDSPPRRRPPTHSPPPGFHLPSPAPIPYALDHNVMMSQAWFRGIYPLEAPASSSDAHPRTPTPPPILEPPKLHVSVLIRMPSPNRARSQPDAEVGPEEEETSEPGRSKVLGEDGEYMIGLADMPASILEPEVRDSSGNSSDIRAQVAHQTNWLRGLAHENI
ncbi:hypothetical protein EVG20_g3112 [Dentipellis fragilis]|uniref:Uncharacterized protein n=1 Tax=Dentipellis fragilis TaxID=205917 RepID=A0A4Y9Z6W6_9AGAM|nr:hypothetical protein EVG20_g3112 [Dentipellis fragilis]